MKVVALALFIDGKLIYITYELSHLYFFQRETAKQYCLFGMRTLAERTEKHTRRMVKGDYGNIYSLSMGDGTSSAITDSEYPESSAYLLLSKCLKMGNDNKELNMLFSLFQNPREGDKLYKIEQTLEEVKTIMSDNIEKVLQRGESLETLIEKSNDLSKQAKMFSKDARRLNACCRYI